MKADRFLFLGLWVTQVCFGAEFNLQQFKGKDAYWAYKKIKSEVDKAIDEALLKKKETVSLKTKAFLDGDYEKVLCYSKEEIDAFPIGVWKGLRFRMTDSGWMEEEKWLSGFSEEVQQYKMDPFQDVHALKIDEMAGVFYLYKGVGKSQLCSIQTQGLDSKFGGRGGASEKAGISNAFNYDPGKMFFASNLEHAMTYIQYFDPGVVLTAKIPLELAPSLNLSWHGGEWFIAGTVLPAEYLYIDQGSELVPLLSLSCQ